ncbi:putative motility protein [Chromobacterium phragmitis]|uniref:Motility protein n=1 Tax=Chromobacterium phragmitis TaxID=2202141 RepID=A0A344UE44_9NEIS|nr:putative motility protein [Chromobacterium phragmitis]AXE32151.1 putative motility protein [Chromobacterium phragmitis]AXE33542.1 putative motility protein [Chromobacterium phragmitis]
MNAVSQVNAQNVSGGAQVFALKKAMQADAQSTLTLLQGAEQSAQQIQASNPAHLGRNIDVRA